MFNQHYSHQRQTKKVLRLRFSLRQDKDWQKLATKRTSIHTILHEYNLDNSHDNQLCVSLDNASRHHSFNHAFFLLFRARRFGGIEYDSPAGIQDLSACGAKLYIVRLAQNGRCRYFAIRIEDGDETAGNEVEDIALHICQ